MQGQGQEGPAAGCIKMQPADPIKEQEQEQEQGQGQGQGLGARAKARARARARHLGDMWETFVKTYLAGVAKRG